MHGTSKAKAQRLLSIIENKLSEDPILERKLKEYFFYQKS